MEELVRGLTVGKLSFEEDLASTLLMSVPKKLHSF